MWLYSPAGGATNTGAINTGSAMAAGTSPTIVAGANSGTIEVEYQGSAGHLCSWVPGDTAGA